MLDLETSKPRQNMVLEGGEVTCMARVGTDVWVGSEVCDQRQMLYIWIAVRVCSGHQKFLAIHYTCI